MNVLVTGGTGTLGRLVVMQLRHSGHRARILSRHTRGHVDAVQGDVASGAGMAKAVAGMDAIVHAATSAREPLRLRTADVAGTRRLLKAARTAGIRHFVYVSIVGIDRVDYPYYRTKRKAEAIVRQNLVPWSILRATQFHQLMETFLGAFSRMPFVSAVPLTWKFQPVDPREVARRLKDVVLGEPAGMLPDFGGPEVRDFESLARSWLKAKGFNKRLINLRVPTKFSRQATEGLLLCPDHKDGIITFEQYLAERYPRP